MKPPIPKKIKKKLLAHGDERIDDYYWLRDDSRKNKKVINYLKEENSYSRKWFKTNGVTAKKIFQAYKKRLPKLDESYPTEIDGYKYFSTIGISSEHRKYYRVYKNQKKLILDVNRLAKGKKYYSISGIQPSRNHQFIAYGEDTNGRREYSIIIKDLTKNKILETNHCRSTGGVIWNTNSDGYYYLKKDPKTLITDSLFFHKLNTKYSEDVLIYREKDKEFNLSISLSRTKKRLFLQISKTESNEFRTLDLEKDNSSLTIFYKRKNKHLYYIDDSLEEFFILSNRNNQENFALYKVPLSKIDEKNWKLLVRHNKNELLENFQIFKNKIVLETRKNGLPQLAIIDRNNNRKTYIKFKDSAYAANLASNPNYNSNSFKYVYSSLTTPSTIYSQSFSLNNKKKIWQQTFNNFEEKNYKTMRVWIKARDGQKIPVSLIYRKGVTLKSAPLFMYGYGSYGLIVEPSFKLSFLPLVDEGFIFAIAHIRGGQDLGREWYDQGRMMNKMNTFFDFIDCTKGLHEKKFGNKEKTFAMGGSAGGLLMGAIINMEPTLYKGIVSAVPFVDVLTTMSDESIPLTTFEYKEWGNPSNRKEYFYIKKYSPYDNIESKPYPSVLVTSSFFDSQVQYFEPAKYVPKLREFSSSKNPILLKMNLIGGHAGKSGRLESLKETAEELSFIAQLASRDH
ncbi:MAG: S9 family peptidase [Gammaproteobacteria bacterium]|tara:strand:- start:4911 stop:6947 length:2037 start_codon:yes stop_codon:yes gene_type:complete